MSYRDLVIADNPLFYLTGEGLVDEIGFLPATLVGGVTNDGPNIAPGLGRSFVFPNAAAAVTLPSTGGGGWGAGYPAFEFWIRVDGAPFLVPPAGYTENYIISTDDDWYVEAYPVSSLNPTLFTFGLGNNGSNYIYGDLYGWDRNAMRHAVTWWDGTLPHTCINGVEVAVQSDGVGVGPNLGSSATFQLGGTTGGGMAPHGRLSDVAIYANANVRDMPAMALRHYQAGTTYPVPGGIPIEIVIQEAPEIDVSLNPGTPVTVITDDLQPVQVITEEPTPVEVITEQPTPVVIQVGSPGTPGPVGPIGPQGVPGTGAATYIYNQLMAATVWVIMHGQGKYPAVYTEDSAQSEINGDISYPDLNTVVITFTHAQGGRAFLN